MRNAQVAEWILSLVTTPERAASTVGDLMESAPSRGRFWFGVLRTAVSLLWRELAANPARMARLAGSGFLVGLVMIFVCFFVIIPLTLVLSRAGVQDGKVYVSWPFTVGSMFVMILVPFQQGRWVARWSPGQELAACVALTILTAAVDAVLMALRMETVFQLMLSITSPLIPMFAGALWVRRKRLSH
jgi:hypothetical protein